MEQTINPYVEVNTMLQYLPEDEYQKINKEQIKYIENNAQGEILNNIDLTIENASEDAKAIYLALFMENIATEEQKRKLIDYLINEEEKIKQEKYGEFVFKSKNKTQINNKMKSEEQNTEVGQLIVIKNDSFIQKIITKIKNFFINKIK